MTTPRVTPRHRCRRAGLAACALSAVLVLAACGGDEPAAGHGGHDRSPAASTSTASTHTAAHGHNDADIAFASGMIPHHRQAIEMAELAPDRAASGRVKSLARKIDNAQAPEIKTMTGWLRAWGEPVPDEETGTDHSEHGASGMASAVQMRELKNASGDAFDIMFLNLMITHHRGAVAMAKTEKADGSYPPTKTMATDIITSQSREITQMTRLLDR